MFAVMGEGTGMGVGQNLAQKASYVALLRNMCARGEGKARKPGGVLRGARVEEDIASRRHFVEILSSFLNLRCARRWLGPNLSTRKKKGTQKAPARLRP